MILGKRMREREREREPLGEVRPPNLLNLALFGLACSCLHPCLFCSHLGSYALAPSVLAPSIYVQKKRKAASRQAKEITKR